MSTVAERKKEMGFINVGPKCSNCKFYSSKVEEKVEKHSYATYRWNVEKEIRCTAGDFKPKKTSWCNKWESSG